MEGFVQVKADVPRELKRRAFAAFALREEKFARWLRTQLEQWLEELQATEEEHRERLLDLKHAADYCCLSVRKLREYLGHPIRPLPAHLVGGKWLVRREELDDWLQAFPRAGEETDRIVDEVLQEVRGGK